MIKELDMGLNFIVFLIFRIWNIIGEKKGIREFSVLYENFDTTARIRREAKAYRIRMNKEKCGRKILNVYRTTSH